MCFDYVSTEVQCQFLTTQVGIIFPPNRTYQLCQLNYDTGKYEVSKQLTEQFIVEDDAKEFTKPLQHKLVVDCHITAYDTTIVLHVFNVEYIMKYMEANSHLRFIFIPLNTPGDGAVGSDRIITKYLTIDIRRQKAFLFDPMGSDAHLRCQSIYYKLGSMDIILQHFCKQINVRYIISDIFPKLYEESHHILLWCLWLATTLRQNQTDRNHPYHTLMENLNNMPPDMKCNYICSVHKKLMDMCNDAQLQIVSTGIEGESPNTDLPKHVAPEDQYDQLQAVLNLSMRQQNL